MTVAEIAEAADTAVTTLPQGAGARMRGFTTLAGAQVFCRAHAFLRHETVNDQLAEQFAIGRHHAHTFRGPCARLYTKLAAHTLCIYRSRRLGTPDWLRIEALAFPNNEHKGRVR